MEKIFKIIFVATIAVSAFFGMSMSKASAATSFNTNPNDFATTRVTNDTQNPGCTSCWSGSATMAPGEVVSVTVYYHNTGNEVANDTRIRLSPQNNPATNQKIFAGGVWASNAPIAGGYATVTIPGTPQTITFIPGTAILYPEHSISNPQYLNSSQESALFSTAGVSIGNILQDSTCPSSQTFCHQGSLVARFRIGNAVPQQPQVYACNDQHDNDGDGLTDYPNDPGCLSPTDNDEYNYIPPVQTYACNDHQDNDNDGLVDYPNDPGCYGPTDNDEYDAPQQQAYITASTQPATSVSQNSGTLNGTYATNQNSGTNWFEWGTSYSNLVYQTNHQNFSQSSGNFTSTISNLSSNTIYYFRACADTSATQKSCGNTLSFSTNYIPPQQNYNAPTVVTVSGNCSPSQTSIRMAGTYNSNGTNPTSTWFQYGTSYSLGYQAGNQSSYSSSGNFDYILNGLAPNTTYYFQAVAQNQGGTSNGTILACTTLNQNIYIPPVIQPPIYQQTAPVVTTVPASSVSQTSARLNGYLNTTGNSNYNCSVGLSCVGPINQNTDIWFEWGTNTNLGYTTNRQNAFNPMTYNSFISGLRPDTNYFFRAVAQNNFGVTYGQIISFTTKTTGPNIIYVNTSTSSKGPSISVNLESSYSAVCVGDSIRYLATYTNLTNKTLKDVVVQVILPQEETFMRASRGSYAEAPNTITVLVGNLNPKEKGSFEIEARVNNYSNSSDTLVATATAVYTQSNNAQGDAIAYALINVGCNNSQVGLTLFANGIGCFGWFLILLLIIIAILLARRAYRY